MKKLKSRLLAAALVFISRLGILAANVSPLGSFGFFADAPLLYFATIFIFDYFVGGFYPGFGWTYVGFATYPILGKLTQGNVRRQVVALPLASFLFFLISNFGVWLRWYPHSWIDLLTCYTLALPFYTRTLFGDLFFGYGYLLLRATMTRVKENQLQLSQTKII